jgi:hypothetical protein
MPGGAAEFAHEWQADILDRPPMIAPARQFVYPRQIAGEEDTLARGALLLRVRPAAGGEFLATCARGFADPRMPTGVLPCPNASEVCALAGGYAYIIDTTAPDRSTHIPLRPVVEVIAHAEPALLLFVGFQSIAAWGVAGLAWQSARLSYEGIRVVKAEAGELHGLGWDMHTDKEIPFTLGLRSGRHTGGPFPADQSTSTP